MVNRRAGPTRNRRARTVGLGNVSDAEAGLWLAVRVMPAKAEAQTRPGSLVQGISGNILAGPFARLSQDDTTLAYLTCAKPAAAWGPAVV